MISLRLAISIIANTLVAPTLNLPSGNKVGYIESLTLRIVTRLEFGTRSIFIIE